MTYTIIKMYRFNYTRILNLNGKLDYMTKVIFNYFLLITKDGIWQLLKK